MKPLRTFVYLGLICAAAVLFGCKNEDDLYASAPVIVIENDKTSFESLNEGDIITIPVKITAEHGVKRIAYFLINETLNGMEADEPVYIDNTDFPRELRQELKVPVKDNTKELVVICFDKRNVSSEVHFDFAEIRRIPTIEFKDGIKYREAVFEGKKINISGTITSEFELKSTTYSLISNGVVGAENQLVLDGKNFSSLVQMEDGITGIIYKAVNIHNGMAVDTFKIGSVVDDAVNIALKGGLTKIDPLFVQEVNNFPGSISSGTDVTQLSYRIKKDGNYGTSVDIPIGATPDEFDFELDITGEHGMEAIEISAQNAGGKSATLLVPITKTIANVIHFKDIQLTTQIGDGLHDWFSCYKAPYVMDQATARANETMVDFLCVMYSGNVRIVSPHVYNSGTAYREAVIPHMTGFTQANYCLISGERPGLNASVFEGVATEEDLQAVIDGNVVANGYNVYTAARGTSIDLKNNLVIVYGWGSASGVNKAFGLIHVKQVTNSAGVGNITIDVKVPRTDNRTLYSGSARPYTP